MYADKHAIIIIIFVIMLTGLVMSTLQATNPTLEMTIHVIFFTLWVHKTNCYFYRKYIRKGVGAIIFSANCVLVAGYDTEELGIINSNIAVLLQRLWVHKGEPTNELCGFWLIARSR